MHDVSCVALQEWLQALVMVAEELTCTLQEVAERLGADPAQLPGLQSGILQTVAEGQPAYPSSPQGSLLTAPCHA